MNLNVAKAAIAASLVVACGFGADGIRTARAQMGQGSSPCEGFIPLRTDAQNKGRAIGEAEKKHADRKEVCALVSRFSIAEEAALKYLEQNRTWCGIPDQVIASAKTNHDKTLKFREAVCSPAPQPHVPTLSDAIGGPALDTAKNTKTNTGTFNTLTGNPLAR